MHTYVEDTHTLATDVDNHSKQWYLAQITMDIETQVCTTTLHPEMIIISQVQMLTITLIQGKM